MKKTKALQQPKNRENEKGAAMVIVILISFLLLVACAGLLLETSMNTSNVTDAVAEQQAYYAAESGIQTALNVLRGNTQPLASAPVSGSSFSEMASNFNPLNLIETRASAAPPSPSPSPSPSQTQNKIDFRKAVSVATSNYANDPANTPRLSRWLNYNYTPSGGNFPDRVAIGSGNYNPQTGTAFSLTVTDPDNTGDIISFNTQTNGKNFYDRSDNTWKSSITIGTGANTATISYLNFSKDNLDVSSGSGNTNLGKFKVQVNGTVQATDFPGGEDIRFQIIVYMRAPYTMTKIIRGSIKKATFNSSSQLDFDFDSPIYQIMGSTISLTDPLKIPANNTEVSIPANMTQAEPTRVIVRSTGYGPRGAKKELEVVVQKNFFNGMTAPATLTLVGPYVKNSTVFLPGTAAAMEYSGQDKVSSMIIPPIGVTNPDALKVVIEQLCKCPPKPYNGELVGYPTDVSGEMPFWLESPTNLNAEVERLRSVASSSKTLYENGAQPSTIGDIATARGITFVDGDLTFQGSGGGILVVTGKMKVKGNFKFNGLIIITGTGGMERDGGGNGEIQGNVVIAPYNPNNLEGGFLPPKYDMDGGGNSEVVYNSSSVANGMVAVSNFVLGVAEK